MTHGKRLAPDGTGSEKSVTLNRRTIYLTLGFALLACVLLPAAAFAGYNVLYFLREQWGRTPSTPGLATPTSEPAGTATPAPQCGGPPEMFILLIGSDSRVDNYAAGLSDSMRIVRADFINPGISYLVFQRDLYVEIPGIAPHGGITHGKLNQAYLYGNPGFGYFEGPGEGPGLLALTLEHNFGAQVDHYVAVNLKSFVHIVDQLGGLDINLPYTVDGRAARSTDQDKYFPAGQQHLDGYRTMLLARMRPNGDLERSRTQNLILQAFAVRLLNPATLPELPGLASTLYGSTQTDLGADDIAALICLASLVQPEDIQPLAFPDELLTGTRIQDPVLGNTFVWEADFNVLREYVGKFNEGTWSSAIPATPAP
jgi:LCP family protein required for cell wall assembly